MSSIPLIGRDQPRAMLRAEIDRTRSSHGGMVLVTGEPGIGKTALVTEAADEAGAHGAVVLSGTAWDSDGAPGYWPWVQVLRALRRRLSAGEWHEICAAAGDELSYLLGEAETLPGRADMGGESAFRVQDAVTSALVTAAAHRPVVVVLDDLHAADAASITLLEFVARHTWFERLLLIGTYRDTEAGSAAHPLREAIGALLTKATTITLAGLDASDVGNLMAHTAALAPGDDDVVTVHRRTGGNPFFVEQAVRLWQNGSSIEAGAPGIRETLRARLEDLPDAVEWALSGAALLGREFDLPTLAYAVDMGTRELDGLLEQAVTARLVTRVDAEKLSFVHDLIREVLQSVMDSTQARRWHAAIVRGIERSAGRASEGHQAMLADHAYLAVPEIDPDQARARVLAAVEQACGRLAADEVTLHYRRAVDLVPDGERALYAGLMLDFGDVLRCAGKLTEARVAFQEIVGLGRELGDARLFTRAVLGLHDLGLPDPDSDGPGEIALIDEARALLDEHELPANDPLVVQALAAASRVRVHAAPPSEHAQQLSDRALVRARSCGDDATLALGLLARHDAIWEPGTAAERVALAEEMSGVGRRSGDTELEMQGSLLRLVGLLERGDPNAVEEHSALTALTEHARSPRFGYHARSREATLATLQGRFAEAREAIDSAFSLGEELHEVDRFRLWMEQRWALALQEGDAQEADRLIGKYRDAGSDFWLPEIITAAEHGNAAPARRRLTELRGLHEHYPGPFLPVVLRAQTQAAIVTGDAQLRAQARASLTPLRHLWMVVAGGGTVYGPYAFWLARLDAAERRWDDAVAGFTDARASADVLGAPPWSIAARLHLAEALLARKAPGDAATAGELVGGVGTEAAELGMRETAERARTLAERVATAQPRSDGSHGSANGRAHRSAGGKPAAVEAAAESPSEFAAESPSEFRSEFRSESPSEFRRVGGVWHLEFAGRSAHLPDTKGLRDLHALLSRPGDEVPAVDLVNPHGGAEMRAERGLGADVVLDERAKADYRRRLTELGEAIDAASDRHEDERAAALDTERAALLDELRTATGFGGRTRRLGDGSERARKTVTARIRDSLRRLDEQHPELAEHLRASVSTGVTSRYQPARHVSWSL